MNFIECINKINALTTKVEDIERCNAKILHIYKEQSKKLDKVENQLKLTEKALELACERVKYFEEMQDKEMGFYDFFGYDSDYDLQAIVEQYKEQAKEIIKKSCQN